MNRQSIGSKEKISTSRYKNNIFDVSTKCFHVLARCMCQTLLQMLWKEVFRSVPCMHGIVLRLRRMLIRLSILRLRRSSQYTTMFTRFAKAG